jgi:osomolarity two-component system sensor histidine kinase NIK1
MNWTSQAGGDLTKKIEVNLHGQIKELKETVDGMTESLSFFADEVTRCRKRGRYRRTIGRSGSVSPVSETL